MTARAACMLALLLVALPDAPATASRWAAIDTFHVGGRLHYRAHMDRESVPFPWNSTTRSAQDRTRLMLDLNLGTERYGALYVKGVAVWENIRTEQARKRLRFRQGDYLWSARSGASLYSARAFANERRFFVGDMIAPLVKDDLVIETEENRGIRLEADVGERLGLVALYSELGPDNVDSRRLSFLWAGYSGRVLGLRTSYLFDSPRLDAEPNQAVFKTEASAGYRDLFLALTYQLSGRRNEGVFFPDDDGALITELRLTSRRLREVGWLRLVYRYSTLEPDFVSNFGLPAGAEDGHTVAAYYRSTKVSLNGRLLYHYGKRNTFQDQRRGRFDAGLWGHFNPGLEFLLRGTVVDVEDAVQPDEEINFIHAALRHERQKIDGGVHIMWQDLGTIYSQVRFGVAGRVALSPNWGVHWWVAGGRDFDVNNTIFARLEYRPSDQIFLTFGYGWSFVGDGPFLLEDRDFNLSGLGSAVYNISVRGDF